MKKACGFGKGSLIIIVKYETFASYMPMISINTSKVIGFKASATITNLTFVQIYSNYIYMGNRVAKLPETLIFVTVTGNVTVTLVTMTEIAEEHVYMHIQFIS